MVNQTEEAVRCAGILTLKCKKKIVSMLEPEGCACDPADMLMRAQVVLDEGGIVQIIHIHTILTKAAGQGK